MLTNLPPVIETGFWPSLSFPGAQCTTLPAVLRGKSLWHRVTLGRIQQEAKTMGTETFPGRETTRWCGKDLGAPRDRDPVSLLLSPGLHLPRWLLFSRHWSPSGSSSCPPGLLPPWSCRHHSS